MLYHWYEMGHAALGPLRAIAEQMRYLVESPFNPISQTPVGRHASAACEVFERTTRRYEKPAFGLTSTRIGHRSVAVREDVVWERPFCRLTHFQRDMPAAQRAADPRILLVAPMSGHFATLLRGTVETLLPNHEVYITDWQDARSVPAACGRFGLDDYIEYVREMLAVFHGDVHVFAVCQSAVPVLAAVSLMEEDGDPSIPLSMIFAGGPIDTRESPTAVNDVAVSRGTDWFARHAVTIVPWPYAGAGRRVYPGFLQLSGFMSMNLDRHAKAHKDLFHHLVTGDGCSAEKHREFYDEYLAVMDLTAEFYLDTIDQVFVRHALPKGEMMHRGRRIDPSRIRRAALMTIEGEKDDITGLGQCRAALDLCAGLPAERKIHVACDGVGHYGVFNGSRFRAEIAPRIAQFVRVFDPRSKLILTRPVTPRRGMAAQLAAGHDPADVAFTFAAANDAGPAAHPVRGR
ncbi:polyhydroxyalkanoate depolymerase [Hyphomicrobium sp.]|uniref:polyhydroxyalkanoate depolymerase n=1 Tax=Hyphomicrobium sp. TaxID=82 RepID=UPI002FDC7E56